MALSHISITESDVLASLRAMLLERLPSTDIIRAQVNRVPEPSNTNFVIITPTLRERLSTNVNAVFDIILTASIAADVMTVTQAAGGVLLPGASLFAKTGLAANTVITDFLTGTGATGTYRVSPSQTVSSRLIFAGQHKMVMPTQLTFQCDVHGPASAENAQRIVTYVRSEDACTFFRVRGQAVAPLHADDPIRQTAFVNAEDQYEDRWTVDVLLQANIALTVEQQFAEEVTVPVIPGVETLSIP